MASQLVPNSSITSTEGLGRDCPRDTITRCGEEGDTQATLAGGEGGGAEQRWLPVEELPGRASGTPTRPIGPRTVAYCHASCMGYGTCNLMITILFPHKTTTIIYHAEEGGVGCVGAEGGVRAVWVQRREGGVRGVWCRRGREG